MSFRSLLQTVSLLLMLTGGTAALADKPGAAEPAVPSGWLAQVMQDIAREEYHFSLEPGGSYSAPNRAHHLHFSLSEQGLTVVPQVGPEEKPAWILGLSLSGYGRDGDLVGFGRELPQAKGDRIEYWRGALDEWYVNDGRGLEHGFTLHRPPREATEILPLVLELSIQGDLLAFMSEDGQEVIFKTHATAAVLRYAGLHVTDARDTEVPARLAVQDGRLRIEIDDQDAVYPLDVDPLVTSPAWTTEGNQDSANFGSSCSTAGDVNGDGFSDIIVAAELFNAGQTDEGKAFLYYGSASGPSTTPSWTAEGDLAFAHFARIVGTAGDVNGDGYDDVLVGAQLYDNGQTNEGSVFLWLGSAAGLGANGSPANADWRAEPDQDDAQMFHPVRAGDVNGDGYDDVLAGAFRYTNPTPQEGAAFLWYGSASGLGANGTPANAGWKAEVGGSSSFFGNGVGSAGDVNADGYDDVIVGAYGFSNPESEEGGAFAWYGGPAGLGADGSAANADWKTEGDQIGSHHAHWVSTAGDVNGDGYADVIVGAVHHNNVETDEGKVLVYHGGSDGLSTTAAWTAEANVANALLGGFVSTAGDVNGDGYADIIAGAPNYANPQTDEGGAFVWLGGPAGLGPNGTPANADWRTEGNQGFVYLGAGIGAAGDVNGDGYADVLTGAPGYTNDSPGEGRAYLYYGSAELPALSAGWSAEGNSDNSLFGAALAMAGDVNGDGYTDILIGAPGYTVINNEGKAYLYTGSPAGPASTPSWTLTGTTGFGQLGLVAGAGDVNGDGYADVIIGEQGHDNGQTDEGRALVYLGSPSGLGALPAWTGEGDQDLANFGSVVASAGDVNGDGFGDVIVGAYGYANPLLDEGGAFVYHGSAAGLGPNGTPANADWHAEGDQIGAFFGASVASAGDVNRDGYSDAIVGATRYDFVETDDGRAYVYHGSASGLATSAAWTASSSQGGSFFGVVASAGDVNGDGYSDVIVGAPFMTAGANQDGQAFAWYGGPAGLGPIGTPSNVDWEAAGDQDFAAFGQSISSAGDVNGDGYSDVIIGALQFSNDQTWEGRAAIYFGSAFGLAFFDAGVPPAWAAEGNQDSAGLGFAVAGGGDVNGDGFGDVLTGAWGYDNGQAEEGRAFLYYGGGSDGRDRAMRQVRADGTAPIAVLGRADSEGAFRLRALGRTTAGRGGVRLEWEVKPLGTPFDGTALGQGASFRETGIPSPGAGSLVPLEARISGLAPATVQHWRARLASRDPFFPRSPWFSPAENARGEADFRTPAAASPFVLSVTPPNLSEGQPCATSVVLIFSEALDAITANDKNILLRAGAAQVPAIVRLATSGREAVIDPAASLLPGVLYTVEVDSEVSDLAGNAAIAFSSTFRVDVGPCAAETPLTEVGDLSMPPVGAAEARLGSSVAAAGDLDGDGISDFVSGAPGYVVGGNTEAGAAVVYLGSAVDADRVAPDIVFTGVAAHDRAGVSVASDFDFNGDGYLDILVGAEQVDRTVPPNPIAPGKVYLIYFDPTDAVHYPNLGIASVDTVSLSLVGQPGGIPGMVFTGVEVGDQAGFAVAARGTPTDPSFPTDPCAPEDPCRYAAIQIGAPGRNYASGPARTHAGAVYVILPIDPCVPGACTISLDRVANGLGNEVAGIVYEGTATDDLLGYAVSFPGDVGGSADSEIAFAAPWADTFVDAASHADAGKVYVARGGGLVTSKIPVDSIGRTVAGTQFLGDQAGMLLGFAVSGGAGRCTPGDPCYPPDPIRPSLLMGAPRYDEEVYSVIEGAGANFGLAVATAGELPEGIIDVCAVGDPAEMLVPGARYTGARADDELGSAVAGLGDVTGDGLDDIAIGAPRADPGVFTDAGATYLIAGTVPASPYQGEVSVATVGTTTAGLTLIGTQDDEHAGATIAGVGDINQGGTADMVVGAPEHDVNAAGDDAGTVYQVLLDDSDGDGTRNGPDCAMGNPQLWSIPGEVWGDALTHHAPSGSTTIVWSAPLEHGGVPSTLAYDTLRATAASSFTTGAVCLETNGTDTTSADSTTPASGTAFYYLVIARNACGAGSAGIGQGGAPRTVRSCP